MALKIKFAMPRGSIPWTMLVLRVALVVAASRVYCWWACASLGYYYFKYQGIVDERLKQPLFANTAKIFAAPREVRPGQKLSMN